MLSKSHFIYQEGPSVQIWWKVEKKWSFYEKRQNLAPRGTPWGCVSKTLPKNHFIYHDSTFVQNWWKSDEKWRFSEKRSKLTPGGTHKGGGQKFFKKFSSNTKRVLQCKFHEHRTQETRVFSTIIAKKKKKKNSSGSETLLCRVKIKLLCIVYCIPLNLSHKFYFYYLVNILTQLCHDLSPPLPPLGQFVNFLIVSIRFSIKILHLIEDFCHC